MTGDILAGFILGVVSVFGIGALVLAAYHDHVSHLHVETPIERNWEIDREALTETLRNNGRLRK